MRKGSNVRRWSDDDIAFLKAHLNENTDLEIATMLCRTEGAVQTKRCELKLNKDKSFIAERSKVSQFKPGHKSVIVPYELKKPRADAWTVEQIDYLKANWEYYTSAEIAVVIGRTRSATTSKALELGVKKSEEATKEIRRRLIGKLTRKDGWTAEQLDYLKANWATQSAWDISAVIGRSAASVKTRANDLGLKTNKEALRIFAQRPNAGMFKPAGGIGTITTRTTKAGLKSMWIKTGPKKWLQLSRHIWLLAGNVIPDNYVLCFKNGDTTDCSIDNLELRTSPRQTLKENYGYSTARRAKRKVAKEEKRAKAIAAKETKRLRLIAERSEARSLRLAEKEAAQLQQLFTKTEAAAEKLRIKLDKTRPANRIINKPVVEKTAIVRPPKLTRKEKRESVKLIKQQAKEEQRKLNEELKRIEREKALLVRQELARKARAQREAKRIAEAAEMESKKVLPTLPVDLSTKIALRIDHRTVIYIRPDQDPESARQKYLAKKTPDRYENLPPTYQF